MSPRSSLDEAKKGSAEILILALLDEREAAGRHGYEIAKLIDERTGGTLTFTLASLYATLYRLEDRGWIKGRWVEKAGTRRRCYYRITDTGRRMLAAQRAEWARFFAAMSEAAGVKL
jgi:PadR family transcriptional regulator PadR